MTAIRPQRVLETSPVSLGQIATLLRVPGTDPSTTSVSYSSSTMPGMCWGFVDTGRQTKTWQNPGDEVIHILHARNELDCRIDIDDDSMPILPGGSLYIGNTATVRLSDSVLALWIRSDRTSTRPIHPPAHGLEQYDGFNRQTLSATGPIISLERWKLTVPHEIVLEPDHPVAFVVLYGHISFIQSRTIETLGAGESLIYLGDPIRVVPDALAYLAIVSSVPSPYAVVKGCARRENP